MLINKLQNIYIHVLRNLHLGHWYLVLLVNKSVFRSYIAVDKTGIVVHQTLARFFIFVVTAIC